MRVTTRSLPRTIASTCAVLLGALCLAGCATDLLEDLPGSDLFDSTPDVKPSPIPPGYLEATAASGPTQGGTRRRARKAEERLVDGLIASVGDRFLTRSEALRRLRFLRDVDKAEPEQLEQEIEQERVRWAELQILALLARQAGIQPDPRRVEEFVDGIVAKQIETASQAEGRAYTRQEWLARKRLTMPELYRQHTDLVEGQVYLQKLLRGVGGPTRPEVDLEVTPGEMRRLFREHPDAFEKPASARIVLFLFDPEGLSDDEHTPAEWTELAERRAKQLAELFERGHGVAFLKSRYQLDDDTIGSVVEAKDPLPIEEIVQRMRNVPGLGAWLNRPELAKGQALLVNVDAGPMVIGVVEHTPKERLSYAEAHDRLTQTIGNVRQQALRAHLIREALEQGSVVSPPELEDLLLDRAQEIQDQIASDDLLSKVRLR